MALVVGVSCGFVTVAPTADPAGGNMGLVGINMGLKCVVPADATRITELGWFADAAHAGGNLDTEIGVHAHDAGTDLPAALIAKSGPTGAGGTATTWERSTVNIAVTPLATVWLTICVDYVGASALRTNYSVISGQRRVSSTVTNLVELFDPFPAAGASVNQVFAIYALYSASTGPSIPVIMNQYRQRRRN